jgi:hypothetical protein
LQAVNWAWRKKLDDLAGIAYLLLYFWLLLPEYYIFTFFTFLPVLHGKLVTAVVYVEHVEGVRA